jgi:hypothetical protein
MKTFRITWFAVVEDGSVLEGRSLVKAETESQAIEELVAKKSQEYRLKPHMISIQSIFAV